MYKGGEQKSVLLHFTFVACAVFRRLDKQCCSEKQVSVLQHSNDPTSQMGNVHKMPCKVNINVKMAKRNSKPEIIIITIILFCIALQHMPK